MMSQWWLFNEEDSLVVSRSLKWWCWRNRQKWNNRRKRRDCKVREERRRVWDKICLTVSRKAWETKGLFQRQETEPGEGGERRTFPSESHRHEVVSFSRTRNTGRKRETAVYFTSIGSTGNWKAGSKRLLCSYILIPPSSLNHAVLDVTSSCVMAGRERERKRERLQEQVLHQENFVKQEPIPLTCYEVLSETKYCYTCIVS